MSATINTKTTKPKHHAEPAPADPSPTPPPAVPRVFDFKGHLPFIHAAADQAGFPARLVPRLTASKPIGHIARVLCGLAELARRTRGRPLWDKEMAIVRSALAAEDECRWHYKTAATACFNMIEDARRAFVPDAARESSESPRDEMASPWRYVGVTPYFTAEAERLGLPDVFVRRVRQSPDVYRVTTRLGDLHQRYLRARKEAGRPVLTAAELVAVCADLDNAVQEVTVLAVLADATEAILASAYAGFGLRMPIAPLPGMLMSKGCDPFRNEQRNRAKIVPFA